MNQYRDIRYDTIYRAIATDIASIRSIPIPDTDIVLTLLFSKEQLNQTEPMMELRFQLGS